jgi:hypothetical protein
MQWRIDVRSRSTVDRYADAEYEVLCEEGGDCRDDGDGDDEDDEGECEAGDEVDTDGLVDADLEADADALVE